MSRHDEMLTPVKLPHPRPSGVLLQRSAGQSPPHTTPYSLAQQTPPSEQSRRNKDIGHIPGTSAADLILHESVDPNLEFADEYQAYTDYKVKGNFTPAPVTTEGSGHAVGEGGDRTGGPLMQPSSSNGSPFLVAPSDSLAVDQLLQLLQE